MRLPAAFLISALICITTLAGDYTQTMSISEPIDQVYALVGGKCGIVKLMDDKGRTATPMSPINVDDSYIVSAACGELNMILPEPRGTYKLFLKGKPGPKCTLDVDVGGEREDRIENFTLILKKTRAIIVFKVKGEKLTVTPTDAKLFRKEKKK